MNESHIPSPFLLSTLADIHVEEGNNTAASNVRILSKHRLGDNVTTHTSFRLGDNVTTHSIYIGGQCDDKIPSQ